MAESENESSDFDGSLTQESPENTPKKKRKSVEISDEDVGKKQSSSKKQKKEKTGGKSAETAIKTPKKWTEKEIDLLLDSYEERACLWDVSSKEYHLKDKREKAYEEIKEKLEASSAEIKAKICGLRAQLGREMVKVRARKSGMALSEVYESNWVYWDRLQFLTPYIGARKSKTTILTKETSMKMLLLQSL